MMETVPDKSMEGPGEEWWSAESELVIWPSHKQLERKSIQVVCRVVVVNETIYQRTASLNVTSASFLAQQIQRSARPYSSSFGQQVSTSMASSQHSRDSFPATNKGNTQT